jgi:hypothetical protein
MAHKRERIYRLSSLRMLWKQYVKAKIESGAFHIQPHYIAITNRSLEPSGNPSACRSPRRHPRDPEDPAMHSGPCTMPAELSRTEVAYRIICATGCTIPQNYRHLKIWPIAIKANSCYRLGTTEPYRLSQCRAKPLNNQMLHYKRANEWLVGDFTKLLRVRFAQ